MTTPVLTDAGLYHPPGCTCGAHGVERFDRGESVEYISLDPFAGGTYADKPIWDVPTIAENLNRSGWDWYTNFDGQLDDGVLNFAFFNTQADFFDTGYINDNFTIAFSEFFDFQAMTPEQRTASRDALKMWDDLINITFQETNVADADIRFGNTDTGGAQAYAYLPFGDIFNDPAGGANFSNLDDLAGDVWIDKNVGSNFFPLSDSYYSVTTLIHELGHSLGLSHPGDYDALDDADGDGVPDPISYDADAFFAQDSLQYSIMSYWDAYETGAQHIDWSLLNFAYAATPLVHDIAAIQAIYGADPNTRTGDTTYGFNSTADRSAYNFDLNTRPIVAIYDAGGEDTLNFSGWNTDSVLDLNEGAFSSGGGIEQFLTLEQINANRAALGFAPRTQAQFDLYNNLFKNPQGLTNGLFKDNISIAYGTIIENAVGGGGDDLIVANNVANKLDGRGGSDVVSWETATSGVTVNLATGQTGGGAAGDRLTSIEGAIGTAFNDVITGDRGDNLISGGSGGVDRLTGGSGNDTLSYAQSTGGVRIDINNNKTGGAAAGDRISGFENLVGSQFDDVLEGTSHDNVLSGLGGADRINGDSGDDVVDGGAGNDHLEGDSGDDTLIGGEGDDYLNGDSGDDVLNGGEGADRLDGRSGIDRYVFDDADGAQDTVLHFERGKDKIDLSAFDFTSIGANAFSGVAGELRVFRSGKSMFLEGDVDGDGVADVLIAVQNTSSLGAADLVL